MDTAQYGSFQAACTCYYLLDVRQIKYVSAEKFCVNHIAHHKTGSRFQNNQLGCAKIVLTTCAYIIYLFIYLFIYFPRLIFFILGCIIIYLFIYLFHT